MKSSPIAKVYHLPWLITSLSEATPIITIGPGSHPSIKRGHFLVVRSPQRTNSNVCSGSLGSTLISRSGDSTIFDCVDIRLFSGKVNCRATANKITEDTGRPILTPSWHAFWETLSITRESYAKCLTNQFGGQHTGEKKVNIRTERKFERKSVQVQETLHQ